jgi:hypothetical protein
MRLFLLLSILLPLTCGSVIPREVESGENEIEARQVCLQKLYYILYTNMLTNPGTAESKYIECLL